MDCGYSKQLGNNSEVDDLKAKLQQAEAAIANMRTELQDFGWHAPENCAKAVMTGDECSFCLRALSTTCGQGWLSPEKARVLTEALRLYHEAWNGEPADWRKAMCEASKNADQALAAVRKP